MKKKTKMILLVFMIFILSGCHATYDVKIDGDDIEEKLTISNAHFNADQITTYTTYPIPVNLNNSCFLDYDTENLKREDQQKIEGVNYYDITSENNTNLKATSHLFINNYKQSRIANTLFNNLNVNHYPDMTSIYGYNGLSAFLTYPELEEVTVNIQVSSHVSQHNADQVKGRTYTWYFSKNTSDSKTLYLEMKKENNKEKKKESTEFYSGYIILGICFICLVIGMILKIYLSKKESHK